MRKIGTGALYDSSVPRSDTCGGKNACKELRGVHEAFGDLMGIKHRKGSAEGIPLSEHVSSRLQGSGHRNAMVQRQTYDSACQGAHKYSPSGSLNSASAGEFQVRPSEMTLNLSTMTGGSELQCMDVSPPLRARQPGHRLPTDPTGSSAQ